MSSVTLNCTPSVSGCVVCVTYAVGSVLLQDEAKGDSQTPVVINMDGADQRLAERQKQLQLIDEQVICFRYKLSASIYL